MAETKKLSQLDEDLVLGYLWAHTDEDTYDEIAIIGDRVLGLWTAVAGGWAGCETIGDALEILVEAKKWEEMCEAAESVESCRESNE